RKLDAEDPANPVAAAATDPNEAAMKIKSRDLINADRQDFRPDPHPHRHHTQARQDSDDDDSEGSEGKEEGEADSKKSGKKSTSVKKKNNSDEGSDENPKEDSGDSDAKQKTKGKAAAKQKSGTKDSGKKGDGDKKAKGKSDKGPSSKDKKDKKTHTGLDGKEVDDEDEENGEVRKKKVQVKHVKAKQRRWRTGKPKYNYKQALEGWKEVGPLYYYKGKYENSALSGRLTAANVLVGSALVVAASAAAMF
ncbi:hypothetical protein LPJ56_006035, partial [Coemansia sp. RSA 2599]